MDVGTLSGPASSFRMVVLCTRSKRSKVSQLIEIEVLYKLKIVITISICICFTNKVAEIDDHEIDIVNSFSCAPAFDDPNNTSYVVYILILGFVIPNITLIFTSTEVLRLHKLVSWLDFLRRLMYWIAQTSIYSFKVLFWSNCA